ncbi:MAG: ABC transporter permease [Janthinobacterium lividum]
MAVTKFATRGTPVEQLIVVPYRGGGFAAHRRGAIGWLTAVVILVLWAMSARFNWIDPLYFPAPDSVARALWTSLTTGTLLTDIGVSLARIGSGWLLGTVAGLAFGLAMGVSTAARSAGSPIVSALFPIPKIALLPLFILWFGIGEPSKVMTIALGVFFPTAISTASGVDNVARNLVRMGLSFNLPRRAIVFSILLPGALPSILSGFRISLSLALILVVSAEMIGAERGLGVFVLQAGNLMQTDQLIAGVAVMSIIGLALGALLTRLEAVLLAWR